MAHCEKNISSEAAPDLKLASGVEHIVKVVHLIVD